LIKPSSRTYTTHPKYPGIEIIGRAAASIKSGGVIAFPTTCLYGLGADAFNTDAVGRLYEIKQRPAQKPILILIDRQTQLKDIVRRISKAAARIMDDFWPGGVTLVFEALPTVPACLTAGSGKIGIRRPAHPVAAALVKAVGGPVTGTSANISGKPGCRCISELDSRFAGKLDLILDAGHLRGGAGSTVVDVTEDIPRILRTGQIEGTEILASAAAQTY
jgi:L-threonylcarbamoyladenylate synthase